MTRIAATVVLLILPMLLSAQDSRSDFAREAEIKADEGSIFRVLLPDDVYETVTRADLGDVRVLNASGDAVPHMLRKVSPSRVADAAWIVVPSFPMRDERTGSSGKTQVKIDSAGAVLEVTGGTSSRRSAAYLVDTTAIKEPLNRLALTWNASVGAMFLARVRVDGSSDLNMWRPVVASAALAQLQRDGFMLVQNEIELPHSADGTAFADAPTGKARYLRISWPAELADVTLTSVRVQPRVAAQELPIRWRTLTGSGGERSDAVVYDAHAMFPVEYVDLEFVDTADAVNVEVSSRPSPDAPWRHRHTGVFYSLQEASGAVRNAPVRIPTASDRYWSIRRSINVAADSNAGADRDVGPGFSRADRAPRLKVGWHPHELVFVAKGSAPYILVYGSARAGAADAPVGAVLASLDEAERSRQVREATVGPARDLGGRAVLTPPRDTRRIVLWSVLTVAVAVLALIAIRTFRDVT